ncbi:MAG: M48 family metalloprotease [Cyanobacteria bacterium P01_D01_bin.36]
MKRLLPQLVAKLSATFLRRLTLFICGLLLTVGYAMPVISQVSTSVESGEAVESTIEVEPSAESIPSAEPEATADNAEESVNEGDIAESETAETEATETEATESETAESETAEPTLTASERIRRKLIIQADSEYEAGNYAAAQALYQQAKDETWLISRQFVNLPTDPFSDEAMLSPGGAVYWREAQAGVNNQRPSQARSALSLLTSEYPEFVPGTVLYASVLQAEGEMEAANTAVEEALTLYPDNTELLLAQVELMMSQEQWLEAAIASRQFVVLNPDHTATPQQAELAAENLSRFQGETREKIRNGAIANLFTGVLGYAFTGSIFGPFTAANSAILLLQGENAVGSQFANQIERQLPMLQHPEANAYVSRMGARLAEATGRRDLDYEFYVILDPNLNAFALPGGKIFVNAGAILDTRSEAELAGLLSHELSHSVLSHGFQLATQGNLTSSVAQYLPYGGIINNVFMSGYSRKMERQADIVGTQILASSGYAADGVYNVMVTLNEQAEAQGRNVPTWISSHPNPSDRVEYLKTLVERGGYNRYAYEGVATHEEIQAIVARELAAYEAQRAAENGGNVEEAVDEAIEEREERTNLYDAVERFDW